MPKIMAKIRAQFLVFLGLSVCISALVAVPSKPVDAQVGRPCEIGSSGDFGVTVDAPIEGSIVALEETPAFEISGSMAGVADVNEVSLYIGDRQIGSADVDDRDRPGWSWTTSAPGGDHTVLVCAESADGRTAGAAVSFSVVEPPEDATVLSPFTTSLSQAQLRQLVEVSDSVLIFTSPIGIEEGDVLLAGSFEPLLPDGLARTVESVERSGGRTILTTRPAAIEEMVWQADISEKASLDTTEDLDDEPPSAPTGVSVAPSASSIEISWALPPPGDGIDFHLVRTTDLTTGEPIRQLKVDAPISRTPIENLIAGRRYAIEVSAVGLAGESAPTEGDSVVVGSLPTIAGTPPPGLVGDGYTFAFMLSGLPAPETLITGGTLPQGLQLNLSGQLTGTPTEAGVYRFEVTATNDVGSQALAVEIVIDSRSTTTSSTIPSTTTSSTIPSTTTWTGRSLSRTSLEEEHLPYEL